jgi:hypothetical protein
MLLRIQYQDNKYNYVSPETLDELIMSRRIRQFFRPSEKRWVDIEETTQARKDGWFSRQHSQCPPSL